MLLFVSPIQLFLKIVSIVQKRTWGEKKKLFNWTKQDKMHKFSRKSSVFEATYNTKLNKQLIHLSVGGWMLGRRCK